MAIESAGTQGKDSKNDWLALRARALYPWNVRPRDLDRHALLATSRPVQPLDQLCRMASTACILINTIYGIALARLMHGKSEHGAQAQPVRRRRYFPRIRLTYSPDGA
jgi:hypothetical protein